MPGTLGKHEVFKNCSKGLLSTCQITSKERNNYPHFINNFFVLKHTVSIT